MNRSAPAELPLSSGRQAAVLVLVVAFLALPSIPTRELLPTDEPRFALVARQMLEDPAPIVPHLGYDAVTREGEIYADKPPMFFWLISFFSFFTGGVSETSARLPSFFSAIASVLLTWRIGRLLIDEATGFTGALILATSNQFFLRAGWCSIDMTLTAFILAATGCWLLAARGGSTGASTQPSDLEPRTGDRLPGGSPLRPRAIGLSALGGFFAAAATLSKGPVGLIFPVAFLAGDRLAHRLAGGGPAGRPAPSMRQWRRGSASPRFLAGALSYLALIGVWILASSMIGGRGYLVEILFKQNVTRYVAAWNNVAPWYYYLYRIPIGLFPWTLLLPGALIAERGCSAERRSTVRGLLVACAALLVFFSASTGKRGVYLLPLYPAMALLIAVSWRRAAESRAHRVIASVHVWTLTAAGLAAVAVLPWAASKHAPDLLLEAWILATLIAVASALAAAWHLRRRPGLTFMTHICGVTALIFLAAVFLVPELNRRAGVADFGARLSAIARPDDFLVVDQEGYEQVLFYSHLRGERRDFLDSRVGVEEGVVTLEPRFAKPRARDAAVQFPAGARVLFVIKADRVDRLRASLGPQCRTLLAGTLYGKPYLVVANRG